MSHAAAHAAAIANAIKASGVLVGVSQQDFEQILRKIDKPLVITSKSGLISTKYDYLTSYKGFVFHTKCSAPLILPPTTEMITAEKIWIPG